MSYYRLRDIKTPPFAYVVNKDEVIQSCRLCQMPFHDLEETLKVEICTTTHGEDWEERIQGKPLMADHWLIGDEVFASRLEAVLPGQFKKTPVEVIAWLTRNPQAFASEPSDLLLKAQEHSTQPGYYYFSAVEQIRLDSRLLEVYPPIKCLACDREIPDIPIDFQPSPDLTSRHFQVACLRDLHLEGYDYLFHEKAAQEIEHCFPEMILEELAVHVGGL